MSRGFLVEIDTQIRRIRKKSALEGDDLKLQRLVWMNDANQSVIAELIAIIASSLVQILMERHRLAFAIGYEPGVALDIPTVFVQMMVELLLEMIVDSTVMWAEGEHGIPITRYFEHVRSLHVAGYHASASIVAVGWVTFSFIRFPTVATCDSSNVCDCLHKEQFEVWFAHECNLTATNQTQASSTTDTDDMFKNVDGFTAGGCEQHPCDPGETERNPVASAGPRRPLHLRGTRRFHRRFRHSVPLSRERAAP